MKQLLALLCAGCLILLSGCASRDSRQAPAQAPQEAAGGGEQGETPTPFAAGQGDEEPSEPPTETPPAETSPAPAPPAEASPAPATPAAGQGEGGEAAAPTVEMEAALSTYPVGTAKVQVTVKNISGEESGFDLYYTIEQKQGEGWAELPFGEDYAVQDLWCLLPAGAESSFYASLAALAQEPGPGAYRVVKKIDGAVVAAEFTLAAKAP